MATRASQDRGETVETVDVERVVIASQNRQRLDGQDRCIPVGSPEDAGVGDWAVWRLGKSAVPSRAPPPQLTR